MDADGDPISEKLISVLETKRKYKKTEALHIIVIQ